MKGIIAAAAALVATLSLAPAAQARDPGNWQSGGQDHGRYDNRSYGRPDWNNRGHGNEGWHGRNDWHGYGGWHGRDEHRWGRPDYRPYYDHRYPRYYYDRPYYGYVPRYVYPPVYRGGYYYDCDDYDGDCDDDGFSLLLSLPLHF